MLARKEEVASLRWLREEMALRTCGLEKQQGGKESSRQTGRGRHYFSNLICVLIHSATFCELHLGWKVETKFKKPIC